MWKGSPLPGGYFFPAKRQEYATMHDSRSLTPQWQRSPESLVSAASKQTAGVKSREDVEREQRDANKREFVSFLSQQIQEKRHSNQLLAIQRKRDADRAKADSELLRARSRMDRTRRAEMTQRYRKALDAQSGQAEQQAYEANSVRFFGCEEPKPQQDFSLAAEKFFGTGTDSTPTNSSSPMRIAKTIPKTILMDPITGIVRTVTVSRGRIHSLGNARPVYVAGKISESPPPRSVFWEQPNFGKKVPRREMFNPLTGERATVGEKSAPNISKSFVLPQSGLAGSRSKFSDFPSGLSPYHYSPASNRQR